jgi:hypothetical protein
MPQDEPPKYLKAGKKDKAEVLKSKLASKRERIGSKPSNKKGNGRAKVTIKPKIVEKNQNQIGTSSAAEKPKLKPKG